MSITPAFLALSIVVEAASSCPTAAQIQEQIKVRVEESGLRGRFENPDPDRVWVEAGPLEVSVELRQPDGTLIGSTKLQADRNCVELAKAIATQVGAWELSLAPSDLGPLPLPSSPTETNPASTLAPSARWRFEPGLALRSPLTAFVPGGSLEATLRHLSWGLGGRLSLHAAMPQRKTLSTLDPGEVEWTRMHAGLGPTFGWEERHLFLDLHAEFLVGAVRASGIGWAANWVRSEFDPGVDLGLRAGVLWKQLGFWVDATVAWWPAHHVLSVERVAQTLPIDTREAFLSLGTTFLSNW